MEAEIVEGDGGLFYVERYCIGIIHQFVAGAERADRVLKFPKVGVHRQQREADPTGHLRESQPDGTCHSNIARAGRSLGPEHQSRADQNQ